MRLILSLNFKRACSSHSKNIIAMSSISTRQASLAQPQSLKHDPKSGVQVEPAPKRQPTWSHPQSSTHEPELKVWNSLTRGSKVAFVPREKGKISWYSCGPTVYDDAHLGHARNYVTIDILRRILQDYFHFKINFVMNITDVDDKIILAGRKRYLYKDYQSKHRYIDDGVRADVLKAWRLFIKKRLPRFTPESLEPAKFPIDVSEVYGDILAGKALEPEGKPGDKEAKIKMYIRDAENCAKALTSDLKNLTPIAFYELAKDAMSDMLDAELGSTIKGSDHHIFKELTEEYEKRFFQDMDDLNVIRPDKLVRVTEYGQQIADFVDQIEKHGFAYATEDGSVYFDISAFERAGNPYARLEPWNRNDKSLQADGEGALTGLKTKGKKSDADFALWKASKPGEMSWPSKWGEGRPGWHIECSAMASDVLGKQMDIHSGGIDLAFPHHDNELAQSEAYWHPGKSTQWVNYFLHMGHLSIAGSKMSKSLKNFTTIRSALEKGTWTSRSLRIVFLLGNWKEGIEVTDDVVKNGQSWEDKVDNFFINAIEASRTVDQSEGKPALADALVTANRQVREALLDSFNTSAAMAAISTLITEYNSQSRAVLTLQDHTDIGVFITRMVNIFGLNGKGQPDTEQIGWEGVEIPEAAKQYVEPLAQMRDQLRQAAIAKSITKDKIEKIVFATSAPEIEPSTGTTRPRPSFARAFTDFRDDVLSASSSDDATMNQQILKLCDQVRDVALWNLNVYLEDRENQPALVRPVTEGLRAARQEKEDRARQKEEAKRKRDEEQRQKLSKGKLRPEDMFRPPVTDEFSSWDDLGLPITMKDGAPVAPSRVKKLRKDWEKQKKAHDLFLQAVQDGTIDGRH